MSEANVVEYRDDTTWLIKGDCIEKMQHIFSEEGCCVDMVLCDPPYGITSNKWDSVINLPQMWDILNYLCEHNAPKVFTASQPFSSTLVLSNVEEFKHEWVWIKNRGSNFANTVREPMKEHEQILVFSKGKWTYNKQMQERTGGGLDRVKYNVKFESKSENYREFEGRTENKLPDMRVPSSWQKFNVEVGLHPTQKPVALMEYFIKTYTNEGDTVLDFTMGSGTTGVACRNLNRNFIGIELDEGYFNIAKNRILNA